MKTSHALITLFVGLAFLAVSGPESAFAQVPPPPTVNGAENITSSSFTATWNPSTGATGYRLDVALDNLFNNYVPGYQNLNVGNTTSWNVTGLTPASTYFYRVRALNASGASGNSGIASTPTLLPAPLATSATNVLGTSFTANWGAVAGAAGYRLDVSRNSVFTNFVTGYQDIDVGDTTSRNVSGLADKTIYYYRVRAYGSAGTSDNSNVISVSAGRKVTGRTISD